MATALIATPQAPLTAEQLAELYANSIVYSALLQAGGPIKASEVARAIGRQDMDLKLTRVILVSHPNMTAVDRKWTLWTRYLDVRNTLDCNLQRILASYGQPIYQKQLAQELAHVYGRPAVIFEDMLSRLCSENSPYFRLEGDYIAPVKWLLNTAFSEGDDEVLFDNSLDASQEIRELKEVAVQTGLDYHKPESVVAFLNKVGKPVSNLGLQFLAWHSDKNHFDANTLFQYLFTESGATLLQNGCWVGPDLITQLVAEFPTLAKREVSDDAEMEVQEAAQPLTIGEPDQEQLLQAILDADGTVHANRLLEDIFDITPDYRTYEEDLQTVIQALSNDPQIVWVGSDRFRPQGTIPGYVFGVPGLLEIPEHNYMDVEGNPLDQLLEIDGFDGGLDREIMNLLVQDVLDEEPIPTPDPNPPSTARTVIKYHHKQIGTLPLCQFPSGFFASTPNILEIEIILPGGQTAQVWVNNETRLLYGLLDWFQSIPIDSGATFTIHRQEPDRYTIAYSDETEPNMFISRNRINELLILQEKAETEELSNYDIVREIMEHYRKGIEFLTLHTELNVVRRATRRLAASILSEYHCFFQRGGAWVFDAKKLTQGFDKSKRKYLVK